VLARVDFHLQFQRRLCISFGLELEHQVHRMAGSFPPTIAEPRQGFTGRINDGADRFVCQLHQIDVLGITHWLLEQQLVDGRAATEGDLSF